MDSSKELRAPQGSKKDRRRVGRGSSSNWGCTAGRGMNGQKSRSGYSRTSGFEGGQMPLVRRIPKFGFTNARFKKDFDVINIRDLAKIEETEINKELLYEKGLISKKDKLVKILSEGEISKAVNITVDKASKKAVEKLEKAGGSVTMIEPKKWLRESKNNNKKTEA